LAESYRGVDVEYVRGKPAVLSVYADGELTEEVNLFDIATLDDLHKMMVEKGFELMPQEEFSAVKNRKLQEATEEEARKVAEREKYRQESETRRAAKNAAAAGDMEEKAAQAAAEEKLSAGEL